MQLIARLGREPRARAIAIAVAIAVIAVAARWRWSQLVGIQGPPYVDPDTVAFQQVADLPLGLDLVIANRPLIVPLVYRIAGNDMQRVIAIQAELAFVAWAALTAAIVLVVRRPWLRVVAVGVGAAFVLAPSRVGAVASLMPESINDSLMALGLAGVVVAVRWPRRATIAAAAVVLLPWLFTRDTNAFVALAAAAIAMAIWRGWRSRGAWLLCGMVALVSGVVLWSTTRATAPLPCQPGWYPPFTARGAYPLLNNLLIRVYSDEPTSLPAAIQPFAEPSAVASKLASAGPELRPAQDWIVAHGQATYARWLARHPIDRVGEVLASAWRILTPHAPRYMPGHWMSGDALARYGVLNRWLIAALLLAFPWLVWGPRVDPRRGIALCLVLSGVLGTFVAYYGDAIEVARHCYGGGQQIVLGLVLALLWRFDRRAA